MNFFKRRKILKNRNYLDLIPVRKAGQEEIEGNKICLLVPKFKNEGFAKWFIPRRKSLFFRINLDETGSMTWLEIDGIKSVREICDNLLQRSGNNLPQVVERVTKFLTLLYENRYISFTVLEEK